MEEPEKTDALPLRIFRRTGKAAVETAEGESLAGRGIVSALRQNTGEPGDRAHPLGPLKRPLYYFVGYLPGLENAVGGVLIQEKGRYRILDARQILLGAREVGVRALLEREEEENGN